MIRNNNLNDFATILALYARKNLAAAPRGTLLIRSTRDGSMAVGVFGNDNYILDGKSRREAELVRRQLKEAAIEELGFGLSYDGYTWALLARPDDQRYQTVVGKMLQAELLKVRIEEMVEKAWEAAGGVAADGAGQAFSQII
jgi:hypothetical protein